MRHRPLGMANRQSERVLCLPDMEPSGAVRPEPLRAILRARGRARDCP